MSAIKGKKKKPPLENVTHSNTSDGWTCSGSAFSSEWLSAGVMKINHRHILSRETVNLGQSSQSEGKLYLNFAETPSKSSRSTAARLFSAALPS